MCTDLSAQAIRYTQDQELSLVPIPQSFYELSVLPETDDAVRQMVKSVVTLDTRTRLGLFDLSHQQLFLDIIERYQLEESLILSLRDLIQTVVLITSRALYELISLRNAVAYQRKEVVAK